MSDVATNAPDVGPEGAVRPIAAALTLLQDAEVVAGITRAEAQRYAHQREAEADLLLQKARRLLIAAEGKAEVIVAVARARARSVGDHVLDLDELGRAVAPGASGRPGAAPSELDKMLEAAIAHAVTDAFPVDAAR